MRVPIAVVAAVVALLGAALGLIGPWWSIQSSGFQHGSYTGAMELGLGGYTIASSLSNETIVAD